MSIVTAVALRAAFEALAEVLAEMTRGASGAASREYKDVCSFSGIYGQNYGDGMKDKTLRTFGDESGEHGPAADKEHLVRFNPDTNTFQLERQSDGARMATWEGCGEFNNEEDAFGSVEPTAGKIYHDLLNNRYYIMNHDGEGLVSIAWYESEMVKSLASQIAGLSTQLSSLSRQVATNSTELENKQTYIQHVYSRLCGINDLLVDKKALTTPSNHWPTPPWVGSSVTNPGGGDFGKG